jgi:isopentenyl-diphosphate delta-isomerase
MQDDKAKQNTVSRKRDHVELCVASEVAFRTKTTGLERVSFVHNALPEVDLAEVDTSCTFLGKPLRYPLLISSMTGGYADAYEINKQLAEACHRHGLAMGVGSQRQALEKEEFRHTFAVVREVSKTIPVLANIGAAEIRSAAVRSKLPMLVELVQADALIIHLNPLQELMQPEGTPTFAGVEEAIAQVVAASAVPVVVKEVGAGLSGEVIRRLLRLGVAGVDVAGAGGTSWAGVEILRREAQAGDAFFWDWGIPTVDCLLQARELRPEYDFALIASGGIADGIDVAKSLALGADIAASARPLIKALFDGGAEALEATLEQWQRHTARVMFLTGNASTEALRSGRSIEIEMPGPKMKLS